MPTDLPIQRDFPLRAFNTFGIAASAHAYLHLTDIAQLAQVRGDAALVSLPRLVLGGGSNLLLTRDFPGLVLHVGLRGMTVLSEDSQRVVIRAGAGESWQALVDWTLAQGFGGLENLSLIPGSVGASPIQNIGAYGAEAGQFITSVRYFNFDSGDIVSLERAECGFGYRDSIFKQRLAGRAVILDVTFALPRPWQANLQYAELAQALADNPAPDAAAISAAVMAIRRRKLPDPAQVGNAGSFFKNPVVSAVQRDALAAAWPQLVSYRQADGSAKLAAGWLIDQCGWKGKSLGAAGVHERQALVLVNRGHATGAEVRQLAQAIQADVQARFGVLLEPEPIIV
jgi:UDP-N-acetylmuramate dehydrogenase